MREPTLKPGTRCECREGLHCGCHRWKQSPDASCQRDAVRMVTVRVKVEQRGRYNDVINRPLKFRVKQVPMCEPCAAFHESKGTR